MPRLLPFVVGVTVFGPVVPSISRAEVGPRPEPPPAGAPSSPPATPPPDVAAGPALALLFVGLQSIQNPGSGTGPGVRLGIVVGARINDQLSLNAEAAFDLLRPDRPVPGVSFYNFEAAAAPFFHRRVSPRVMAVLGPKIGLFRAGASGQEAREMTDVTYTGLLLGANLGAFVRISRRTPIAIGGLFSLDWEKALACRVNNAGDSGISCSAGQLPAQVFASVGAGVLF